MQVKLQLHEFESEMNLNYTNLNLIIDILKEEDAERNFEFNAIIIDDFDEAILTSNGTVNPNFHVQTRGLKIMYGVLFTKKKLLDYFFP